jgi:NTE family protein
MRTVAHVGLVLGAGGLVGHAYHAGVLRALSDHGWDARAAAVVVGTSAGSGVGALLRAGLPARDLAARVLGEPLTAEGARVVASSPRPATTLDFTLPSGGLPRPASPELLLRSSLRWWQARPGHFAAGAMPAGRQPTTMIGERIRAVYGDRRWPQQPLWLCALRLRDGRRAVFGRDLEPTPHVATAVEASSAIPGYFVPVEIDGERYVDGGAHSPTNADLLAGLGFDTIVVVSPMSMSAAVPVVPSRAGRWWWHRQLAREVAPARRVGVRVLVIEPTADDLEAMGQTVEALDGTRMPAVTRQAQRSAASLLADQSPLG